MKGRREMWSQEISHISSFFSILGILVGGGGCDRRSIGSTTTILHLRCVASFHYSPLCSPLLNRGRFNSRVMAPIHGAGAGQAIEEFLKAFAISFTAYSPGYHGTWVLHRLFYSFQQGGYDIQRHKIRALRGH
ncbi:hypothetical protein PLICRDRAFT_310052 [Plicaturopsis crispa FD-325 SS-3]|nr:hypothetical protein PLICRDRAFT_310052 [Plicaturopsis crispa FD-325 SS-3]